MELQEAKDAVFQLMKDKDKIESDLRTLKEILICVRIAHVHSFYFPVATRGRTVIPVAKYIVEVVYYSMICQLYEKNLY